MSAEWPLPKSTELALHRPFDPTAVIQSQLDALLVFVTEGRTTSTIRLCGRIRKNGRKIDGDRRPLSPWP
jgi:hypothetical protein